ncbi:ATP-grasp domain-containing protein [Blastopirellula sp. J2-11]|uniref:ATP-grasp domain-containing protein n=1 Tax=Blastopirellula sp. J2-11 TaxID=2943192 RepID=UPI0021C899EA|nr:ATP-grasp domain-containing protein [Blastopirellula sp. J2-11]UUO05879.1 ATP-grasp domain-containing protein [Blastopirellula sp. J2-11]
MTPLPTPLRIAVVGSSCRAAVACLRRSGVAVVAADQFADADLRLMAPTSQLDHYPHDIPAWLATTDATHWMYVGGLENHPDVVAAAAEIRPLLGVDAPALPAIRDPLLLQSRLLAAGFRFPETQVEPPAADRWISKPRSSAGGLHIRDCAQSAPNVDVVYQRFVPGRCFGAAFVAIAGKAQCLGVMRQLIGRKWKTPQPFQYAGSIGPVQLSPSQQQQLQSLADFLVETTSLQGLFGVDLIIRGDELWPLEINPRFTAGMELLPIDAMRLHLSAWLPEWRKEGPDRKSSAPAIGGKRYLYAPCDVAWTESLEGILQQTAAEMSLKIADIPMPGVLIPRSAPLLTLLGSAAELGVVSNRLRNGAKQMLQRLSSEK